MKKYFLIGLILLTGCSYNYDKRLEKKIVIGFSQCTMVDEWRKAMVEEMRREIVFYRELNIDFIIKDANDDSQKQIKDIQELVSLGIDLLIVSPNEAEELTPIVEEVFNKGIPVIVIDRKINSLNYTAYIGADNLEVGREAGYFASELLRDKGRILEITGSKGSTPAIERSKGFHEIIDKYPKILTTKIIEGSWLEEKTLRLTDSLFQTFSDFNLIFAHNDFMANAASKSARKHNLKTFIIGIDGMSTSNGGVNMIMKGDIDGTILYPTGGDKAIQLAVEILSGKAFDKSITLSTFRINKNNARTIWLQGQQIRDQQNRIDKQGEQMKDLSSILYKRNTFLILTISTIILLILVITIIFISYRNKNRMNKLLDEKNRTIIHQNQIITKQRDDSLHLLIVAEEAKENKLRLFTDLSHELRTVVTLITNPITDILSISGNEIVKNKLKMVQRNTERLARLTDGILKFRSIDENKYHLTFYTANISHFVENILESFQQEANKKNIKLYTEIDKNIYAEFDLGVIEKVMYNLLSNSIKFTNNSGTISVFLKSFEAKVILTVQDTGIGISKKELPFLFNRFNKISNSNNFNDNDKIGIGMALTKELIQLHGGQIIVESAENKGTKFCISIPQFHTLSEKDDKKGSSKELNTLKLENILNQEFEKTVLIVEDNPDILIVIANIIGKYYKVLTAGDGLDGLQIAINKIPDLILSDILMPSMDGMQMCIEIKKHVATCHIPVVLLTAIESQEYTIKGFDIGADAYITKPFNEFLLLSNIKNLIEGREKLKDFFCPSPFFKNLLYSKDNPFGDFIKKCLNNVYENLEDENYTLENLSEKMNMSRSSLYRKIKEVTALKPVDFIKKAKLNYAAKLILTRKDLAMSEISWRSGFSDPKYFSRCFIHEFGMNPSHFAESFMNEKKHELKQVLS